MTKNEKIIVGSSVVIATSAIAILMTSKKYDTMTTDAIENLKDIKYTISKIREDVIVGNNEISEGNNILRDIVKKALEDSVNG